MNTAPQLESLPDDTLKEIIGLLNDFRAFAWSGASFIYPPDAIPKLDQLLAKVGHSEINV